MIHPDNSNSGIERLTSFAEKLGSAFMLAAHATSDLAVSFENFRLAIDDPRDQSTKSAAAEAIKLAKIGT